MHRVLSHAYVWVPIMAPDTLFCPTTLYFDKLSGRKRQEYFSAVRAGLARNYEPMTKLSIAVIESTLRFTGSNAANSSRFSEQVGSGEFDALNVCGSIDDHLKHGMTFCRIDKVGIGSVKRTFEHGRRIAWSVPCVCAHTYLPSVRLRGSPGGE